MIGAYNFSQGSRDIRLFTPFSNKQMTDKFNSGNIAGTRGNMEKLATVSGFTILNGVYL